MKRLLITTGRGPTECRIGLAKLMPVLQSKAEQAGLEVQLIEGPWPDKHGPASVIVLLEGESAESFAAQWTGSIQWIAPSTVRPHHKRKNWFLGVFDLPPADGCAETLNEKDVRFETFRAGGPGGQHQNTTESAVRAVHIPTGLSAIARDERSQHRNRVLALNRLSDLMTLREEIAALEQQQAAQGSHDRLERGTPVKRFRGKEFNEV